MPSLLDLAELLGAPVIDSDGRYAFPSTHPLNLTTARDEALRDADVVLALDVPSLGVPLGPTVRERGNFVPGFSPSTKIIHITLLDLERQSWVSDAMWLLPVHVPIAADTAVALPQLVEQVRARLNATPGAQQRAKERRIKVEAIYAEARKRARLGLKNLGMRSPFRKRASSARSTNECRKGRGRWCHRTAGAGAKRSRLLSRPTESAVAGEGSWLRPAIVYWRGAWTQGNGTAQRQHYWRRRFHDDVECALDGGEV